MNEPAKEDDYPDGKSELLHEAWPGYVQAFWLLFVLGVLYLGSIFMRSI